MNTIIFVSCLLLVTTIQASKLDNTILARYLCRSKENGFRSLVPGSCSQYYECQNGKSLLRSCSRYYNSKNRICVNTNPGCVETIERQASVSVDCTGPCCGISNEDYVLDPNNSQIYYKCQDNCIISKNICPGDLMFDLVRQECASPIVCGTSGESCTTTITQQPCSTKTSSTTTPCTTTFSTTTPCTTTFSTTTPCLTPSSSTTTSCTTTSSTTTPCTTTPSTTTPCTTPSSSTMTSSTTTSSATTPCTMTSSKTTPSSTTPCTTTPSTTTPCTTPSSSTTTSCTTTSSTTTSCTTTSSTTNPCTTPSTTTSCTTTSSTTTPCTTTSPEAITTPCITTPKQPITTKMPCITTTTIKPCTTTNKPCTTTPCITTTKSPCACSHNVATPSVESIDRASYLMTSHNIQSNIDTYMRFACREKPNGFILASLKSCSDYYICRYGQALPVSCGDKYFNALKGICDLPENTNCIHNPPYIQYE